MPNKTAQRKANRTAANFIEAGIRGAFDETGKAFKTAVTKDIAVEGWTNTWEQILGANLHGGKSESPEAKKPDVVKDPKTGAIEVFNSANHKGEAAPKPKKPEKKAESGASAAIDYRGEITKVGEKTIRKEKQTDSQKVQELQMELRQHAAKADQSKSMSLAPHIIQDEARFANKQRVTFFEGLVKNAMIDSKKTAESGTWKGAAKGKNAKRGGDFSIANGKMHQSGERTTIQNAAG